MSRKLSGYGMGVSWIDGSRGFGTGFTGMDLGLGGITTTGRIDFEDGFDLHLDRDSSEGVHGHAQALAVAFRVVSYPCR